MGMVPVRRALLSVSDKTGLADFAARLRSAGVELVASGGTAALLKAEGIAVTPVQAVTEWPEMLGGRVKTLHPRIHGGILADPGNPDHARDLDASGIAPFDLVVVNLYPFGRTVASGASDAEVVEQIDIGGPAMVRAAAKNHARVAVVVDPERYETVAAAVEAGGVDDDLRRSLAREAFFHTAAYDAAIVAWLESDTGLPARMVFPLERTATLRYGENPDQRGAVYREAGAAGWWTGARQLQGKQMSFNNYLDTEAAWRLVNRFTNPAAVIVKHANPCGVAVREDITAAFGAAWECDPLSAFGGVVALNRDVDAAVAGALAERGFVEVLIGPEVTGSAAAAIASRTDLRVIAAQPPGTEGFDLRRLEGGFVAQERDSLGRGERTVVSDREPTAAEAADLEFAWTVAAHTKSNAIVLARDGAAIGVGAGDQSRVGAAERAVVKAGDRCEGSVAASDAFLPFRDGLDTMARAGVTALIEPGGSVRDDEVIAAANEHGMALVFTGRRHFLH